MSVYTKIRRNFPPQYTCRHGDPGQHSVIFPSARITKVSLRQRDHEASRQGNISEKVPSEKKQGASSDNTSICPVIPSSENELWLAVVPEQSNKEPPNVQLKVQWVCSIKTIH